jgi:hypothetical protein
MAGGLILLGSAAVSAQPQNAAVIAKRQLSECMTRQMAANKAVSYNAALRVCKERLQPPKETLASISPADAGAKSR